MAGGSKEDARFEMNDLFIGSIIPSLRLDLSGQRRGVQRFVQSSPGDLGNGLGNRRPIVPAKVAHHFDCRCKNDISDQDRSPGSFQGPGGGPASPHRVLIHKVIMD